METLSPALLFWESKPPWRKQQRFQTIATTVADLTVEGLNAQAVNDLLTMYVGAACQHVLRMSIASGQEALNFDRQVTSFWSRLIQRDIASPLFSAPQAWRTWSRLCSSTPRGCSMARVAVACPHATGNNPVTGHRLSLQFNTTTTSSTCTTPNHPFPTNETKPTFANHLEQPPPKKHSKEASLHPQAILQQPHRHTH